MSYDWLKPCPAPKRIETHRESSHRDRSREKWEAILQIVQKPRAKGECLWQKRRKTVGTLNTGQKTYRQGSPGRDSEQKCWKPLRKWSPEQASKQKYWKTIEKLSPEEPRGGLRSKTIEKHWWTEAQEQKPLKNVGAMKPWGWNRYILAGRGAAPRQTVYINEE